MYRHKVQIGTLEQLGILATCESQSQKETPNKVFVYTISHTSLCFIKQICSENQRINS